MPPVLRLYLLMERRKRMSRSTRQSYRAKANSPSFKRWKQARFDELNGKCPDCGKDMILPTIGTRSSKDLATVDHMVDLAAGGKNSYGNMKIICGECNHKKAVKDFESRNKKNTFSLSELLGINL